MRRQTYETRQRETLCGFFRENPDVCFTPRELADRLGAAMSLSAVYRNLASLAAAGFVSVSAASGETTRRYRLSGHGPCAHHLHFACVRCGRIAHLSEAQTKKVSRLLHAEGLSLDLAKTLMQGTCPACRRKEPCAAS